MTLSEASAKSVASYKDLALWQIRVTVRVRALSIITKTVTTRSQGTSSGLKIEEV